MSSAILSNRVLRKKVAKNYGVSQDALEGFIDKMETTVATYASARNAERTDAFLGWLKKHYPKSSKQDRKKLAVKLDKIWRLEDKRDSLGSSSKEGFSVTSIVDFFDLLAAVAGLIPGFGIIADLAGIVLSVAAGDVVGTLLSIIAIIPFVGTPAGVLEVFWKIFRIVRRRGSGGRSRRPSRRSKSNSRRPSRRSKSNSRRPSRRSNSNSRRPSRRSNSNSRDDSRRSNRDSRSDQDDSRRSKSYNRNSLERLKRDRKESVRQSKKESKLQKDLERLESKRRELDPTTSETWGRNYDDNDDEYDPMTSVANYEDRIEQRRQRLKELSAEIKRISRLNKERDSLSKRERALREKRKSLEKSLSEFDA